MLYSSITADKLLACYIQKPSLMVETKYPIEKEEFQMQIHRIIFVACYNLYVEGCSTITVMDIDNWMSQFEVQYNIFNDNNGVDYINTIIQLTDCENFQYYYDQFRKFSCLNAYKELNWDITKFYDETKSEESQLANLNQYSTADIINYFEGLQTAVSRKFKGTTVKEEYIAGSDFMATFEEFKQKPLLGNSFQSGFLNSIFNGMFGYLVRGGGTGSGKSILTIGDLCQATIKEVYDKFTHKFVENKSRSGKGLFINTELDLRKEIDPMIIAWISKVERNKITHPQDLTEDELRRIEYANEVLAKSPLYIVDDPEFTTKSLKDTIKDYAYNYGVDTVCFDYIQNNGFVAKEISAETNVPQREDMVLLTMSERLKQIQRECGITLIAPIQLNGKEEEMANPNEGCFAGGRATARKIDGGMIMLKPTKKELTQIEPLIMKWNNSRNGQGFGGETIYPNMVTHIVKGRSSKYDKYIKVFQYADLGTSTTIDMFCTDKDNNPIAVENLVIEFDDQDDIND